MRLSTPTSSWTHTILAALALVPAAGCYSRTDVQCGTTPVLLDGKPTGLEQCSDGVTHRAEAVTCESHVPRAAACTGKPGACATDADCTAKPFGMCDIDSIGVCSCIYGCKTDADCLDPAISSRSTCLCADPVGQCVLAQCATDAECKGSFCTVVHHQNDVLDVPEVACLSPDNECEIDADCRSGFCAAELTITGTGRRCANGGGSLGPGRPFLVGGVARHAEVVARDDWRRGDAPEVSGIPACEREAIAAGWASSGLLEHASIAAFARFALQLLALGAPPELICDAQAAMADETEHTRLCFAITSAYAGRPIGPGPLPIRGALEASAPREILVTAILEGCIGETVAAIEADELARRAEDPAVRRALTTISADETRHAELGWRFVRWAIEQDASLAALAEATFAAALERAEPSCRGEAAPDRSAHGLASEPLRRAIAREALLGVIRPCAEALLRRGERRGELSPGRFAPSTSICYY